MARATNCYKCIYRMACERDGSINKFEKHTICRYYYYDNRTYRYVTIDEGWVEQGRYETK